MKATRKLIAIVILLAIAALAVAPGVQAGVGPPRTPPDSSYNTQGQDLQQLNERFVRFKDLANILKALRNVIVGANTVAGASLSVGTTVAKVRTNVAISYRINGAWYFKASTDDFCVLPVTVVTNVQSVYFRFEIDTTGACVVTAGPISSLVHATDRTIAALPVRGTDRATLGTLLVQGVAFTGATTTTAADANRVYVNGDPDLIDLLEP